MYREYRKRKIVDVEALLLTNNARLLPDDHNYAVTISGDVFSKKSGGKLPRQTKWREMIKHNGNGQGRYLSVGTRPRRLVHRIVAEAFLGKSDLDVRHLDGNHQNNMLSNLAYGTRKENMHDAILHGTTCKGDRNARSVLNKQQVLLVKKMLSDGLSVKAIAARFSVSLECVYQIRSGKRWGWLNEDLKRAEARTDNDYPR